MDKAQLETEELSLSNGSLTQEIVQVESRIQDLREDLAKYEIVHAVMRKSKIDAVPPLLEIHKPYYFQNHAEVMALSRETKRRQDAVNTVNGQLGKIHVVK